MKSVKSAPVFFPIDASGREWVSHFPPVQAEGLNTKLQDLCELETKHAQKRKFSYRTFLKWYIQNLYFRKTW